MNEGGIKMELYTLKQELLQIQVIQEKIEPEDNESNSINVLAKASLVVLEEDLTIHTLYGQTIQSHLYKIL